MFIRPCVRSATRSAQRNAASVVPSGRLPTTDSLYSGFGDCAWTNVGNPRVPAEEPASFRTLRRERVAFMSVSLVPYCGTDNSCRRNDAIRCCLLSTAKFKGDSNHMISRAAVLTPLEDDGAEATVKTVDRAARLLRAVAAHAEGAMLSAVARETGFGKGTVHRLLNALIDAGLV